MSEPTIDAQRLAALLDGRLDSARRAEVLRQLAASEPAFDAVVEASAVLRDLDNSPAESVPGVHRPASNDTQRRLGRRRRWFGLAVLATGVAATTILWVHSNTAALNDPGRFSALLTTHHLGLPRGLDRSPWGQTRGGIASVSRGARAARIGARLVDLDLALASHDTSAAALATEIAILLDDVPASAPVTSLYRAAALGLGAGAVPAASTIESGRRSAMLLAGQDMATLGALAESGRVAAIRHDTHFLRARAVGDELDRGSASPMTPEGARGPILRLRVLSAHAAQPDWDSAYSEFTALLAAIAT